ncbi:MAG: alpha/beta hydrolase family protein [Acholeplasmataceae bacterium]
MKPLTIESFLDFRYIGNIKSAPDHKHYACVVARAHLEKNEYHHTLYIKNQKGMTKLMNLKTNQGFVFLDDNTLLINFQRTKKEEKDVKESFNQSYYEYDLTKKTMKKAFTLPIVADIEHVISDDVLLLSATLHQEAHILYEGTSEQRLAYIKKKKKTDLYEDIDCLPYHFNGSGFTHGLKKQLFLYDLKRKALKRVFEPTFHLETYTLSSDHSVIYYTGKEPEKVKSFTSKIYAYHIKNDAHDILYHHLNYNIVKLIEFDHQLIVAAKDMQSYGINQNPDFYRLESGELSFLASFGQSLGNTVGTDTRYVKSETSCVIDQHFYFLSTIDDHTEIKSLNIDGHLKTVYQMPGAIDGLIQYQDNLLMVAMVNQKLQEIYTLSLNDSTLKQITKLNHRVLSSCYVAKPKTVVLKKKDHEVKGFVLLPKDYDKTKSYPAILNIHGGPKTVYGQIYYHEMQYWANEGYIVFFANPRGSDGKGNDFADIRGKYGTIDYEDLMDFTQLVLNKYPAIDQQRLYVTGGSYGGFMTNWIVGHTHMFKAAATQRSISNWISFYGTSDIGYYFATDQAGGHPIVDMAKLYEQSPIKYVMHVETPLLFIHSDKDHRCPMEQAQQFYAILKTKGVDTKLIWIKNENHELSRSGKPQARIKRLTEITHWFNQHV